MHVVPSFPGKTQQLLNGEGIDDSKEYMSGITDDHENHEKCDSRATIIHKTFETNSSFGVK